MKFLRKVFRLVLYVLIHFFWYFKPKISTSLYFKLLSRLGVKFTGHPNYISARVWFDSSEYSKIQIGDQVTISSNVRILTHDWSPNTVLKAYEEAPPAPLGKHKGVNIGDFSFVGTGAILMPGCKIGVGVIIGAGSVVRGDVPDFSIVIGNPSIIVGDSRDYVEKVKSSNA